MLNPDPEKFAALPEAFNTLGRTRFGERWTGTELAARNLPPPKDAFRALKDADIARARAHQELDRERRAKVEKAKKAASGGVVRISRRPRSRPPTPEALEQEQLVEIARHAHLEPEIVKAASNQSSYRKEYQARARRDKVENEFRNLLHGKRIPATLLNNHDGRLVDIPPTYWLANKFTIDFASGQAGWADLGEGRRVTYQGVVLIDRLEFDRVVMDTQPLKSKPSEVRRRSGRKKGSGSFAALDEPLLEEMNKMISSRSALSVWAAAQEMAAKAAGAGTIESKAKRLVRGYREQQN